MNPAIVKVDGNEYLFLQDGTRPEAARLFAIVEMQLLDEATELPIRSRITISGDRPELSQRLMNNGFAGLVGIPEKLFHGIDLASISQEMTIECAAQGYQTVSRNIIIGPFANYPEFIGTALPVSLGSVEMPPEPE